jgi:hypothetical protein
MEASVRTNPPALRIVPWFQLFAFSREPNGSVSRLTLTGELRSGLRQPKHLELIVHRGGSATAFRPATVAANRRGGNRAERRRGESGATLKLQFSIPTAMLEDRHAEFRLLARRHGTLDLPWPVMAVVEAEAGGLRLSVGALAAAAGLGAATLLAAPAAALADGTTPATQTSSPASSPASSDVTASDTTSSDSTGSDGSTDPTSTDPTGDSTDPTSTVPTSTDPTGDSTDPTQCADPTDGSTDPSTTDPTDSSDPTQCTDASTGSDTTTDPAGTSTDPASTTATATDPTSTGSSSTDTTATTSTTDTTATTSTTDTTATTPPPVPTDSSPTDTTAAAPAPAATPPTADAPPAPQTTVGADQTTTTVMPAAAAPAAPAAVAPVTTTAKATTTTTVKKTVPSAGDSTSTKTTTSASGTSPSGSSPSGSSSSGSSAGSGSGTGAGASSSGSKGSDSTNGGTGSSSGGTNANGGAASIIEQAVKHSEVDLKLGGKVKRSEHTATGSTSPSKGDAKSSTPAKANAGASGSVAVSTFSELSPSTAGIWGGGSIWTNPFTAAQLENFGNTVDGIPMPAGGLIKIYKAAARKYNLPWEILAAINFVETDYGTDLSLSTAGAEGWMEFMPGTWAEYGEAVSRRGRILKDTPGNPWDARDAIYSAARLLVTDGAHTNLARAVYGYNHAGWYVQKVLTTAEELTSDTLKENVARRARDEKVAPVHPLNEVQDREFGEAEVASRSEDGAAIVNDELTAMRTSTRLLDGIQYTWGGGHSNWVVATGYDCSGFVSEILHSAGYLTSPQTTQTLPGQTGIAGGAGKWVTIYDRTDQAIEGDHVIIDIDGQWWESGGSGLDGGAERVHRIYNVNAGYLKTFNLRLHPVGL